MVDWGLTQRLRTVAFRNPLYALSLGRGVPRELALLPPDPWPGQAERGQELIAGLYRFAGEKRETDRPPWKAPGAGNAFRFELHNFEWLRDLRAVGGDGARRHARALVADWIETYDRWDAVAWQPDTLGLRIANWLAGHDFFCASAEDDFRRTVFASIARQTRHLARALPGGLKGQRLMMAMKGLIYGGLALQWPDDRLQQSLDQIEATLPEQILPDGGHIERNPGTLMTVLRHLIDIRAALRAFRVPIPDDVEHAIDRMAPALRFFRHGDGGLALFNGAFAGQPVLIDTILAQADARGRPLKSAVQSGYERAMQGRTLLLVDVGGPPPNGLDKSAHAGLLAFELSVGRERLFVNCGAWPGGGGEAGFAWHQALRATAAHTTMVLGDTNALALLPDGGVIRRGQPLRTLIEMERQEGGGSILIQASHEGYRHGFSLVHKRRLYLTDNGSELRGEDVLEPDRGRHRGGARFHLRFHLHPGVQALMAQGGDAALLRLPGGVGFRFRAVGGELELDDSLYFGDPREPRRSRQLVVAGTTAPDGATVRWELRREKRA